MILYRPTDGEVEARRIPARPRTAFIMAQLGGPVPEQATEARDEVTRLLSAAGYGILDADSVTTGRDFLLKIWHLVVAVPVGIAIVHEGIPAKTMANIFLELGWMQSYGKETVVVRVGDVELPSDLVRTEYVPFDSHFDRRFRSFLYELEERAEYYLQMADLVEQNPLLAIDYLRRAYLLTGDAKLRGRVRKVYASGGFTGRAKNSVESLLAGF